MVLLYAAANAAMHLHNLAAYGKYEADELEEDMMQIGETDVEGIDQFKRHNQIYHPECECDTHGVSLLPKCGRSSCFACAIF